MSALQDYISDLGEEFGMTLEIVDAPDREEFSIVQVDYDIGDEWVITDFGTLEETYDALDKWAQDMAQRNVPPLAPVLRLIHGEAK